MSEREEKLKEALGDMIFLAGGLCDDDWYYGERRDGAERLMAAAKVHGGEDVVRWVAEVTGTSRAKEEA